MTTQTQTSLATFAVDPAHSRLGFTVRHMGFSKVRGSFERFEGTVRLVPGDLATLEAEASVEAASVDTNEPKRDAHLRSADFFEVDAFPAITFRSTAVRDVRGDAFTLVGAFTLHGVTRTIALDAVYLGEARDPWGGTRVAFEARTKLDRRDYGLTWNAVLEAGGFLVSDEVEITLEIQAVRTDDEAAG